VVFKVQTDYNIKNFKGSSRVEEDGIIERVFSLVSLRRAG
jgi:hypothetical protein